MIGSCRLLHQDLFQLYCLDLFVGKTDPCVIILPKLMQYIYLVSAFHPLKKQHNCQAASYAVADYLIHFSSYRHDLSAGKTDPGVIILPKLKKFLTKP